MRQIVLDTETTGLEPAQGHRIIEIGCRELVNRRLTDQYFHQFLQPGREVEAGALEIHGIDNDFLRDKPRFAEIVEDFVAFVRGAELIIHNAPFDVGFINHELELAEGGWGPLEEYCTVLDTLAFARTLHPGQKNSLDALCRRYGIDNSGRELHGALLDAELLADVYLAMTGGQAALQLDVMDTEPSRVRGRQRRATREPIQLKVIRPTARELEAHRERLKAIDKASEGQCLWLQLEKPAVGGAPE